MGNFTVKIEVAEVTVFWDVRMSVLVDSYNIFTDISNPCTSSEAP